jgi:hypothetical protein
MWDNESVGLIPDNGKGIEPGRQSSPCWPGPPSEILGEAGKFNGTYIGAACANYGYTHHL